MLSGTMRWLPAGGITLVLILLIIQVTSGTYIGSVEKNNKDNKIDRLEHVKRYGPAFKNDRDISRYLKIYGMEMMLWRCRNAIQPYWNWKPINFVELYCEAIGRLKRVSWYHNGQEINIMGDRHYSHMIIPHYANGRYFSRWIDFRLKIYNATTNDSGLYTFKAWSPSGYSEDQMIYVDISEKKKKKKKRKHDSKSESRMRRMRMRQHKLEEELASTRPQDMTSSSKMVSSKVASAKGRVTKKDINNEHVPEMK